jgi:hypothetical protein
MSSISAWTPRLGAAGVNGQPKIERRVGELGGIKSLYSDSYFAEDEFGRFTIDGVHRGQATLRSRGLLGDLYAKCVLGR